MKGTPGGGGGPETRTHRAAFATRVWVSVGSPVQSVSLSPLPPAFMGNVPRSRSPAKS